MAVYTKLYQGKVRIEKFRQQFVQRSHCLIKLHGRKFETMGLDAYIGEQLQTVTLSRGKVNFGNNLSTWHRVVWIKFHPFMQARIHELWSAIKGIPIANPAWISNQWPLFMNATTVNQTGSFFWLREEHYATVIAPWMDNMLGSRRALDIHPSLSREFCSDTNAAWTQKRYGKR